MNPTQVVMIVHTEMKCPIILKPRIHWHLWKDMRSKRTGPVSMAELAQDAATASVTLRSLPRP